jgi:hypothetical protein
VMTWLLAMRTALLCPRFTLVHLFGDGISHEEVKIILHQASFWRQFARWKLDKPGPSLEFLFGEAG